MTDHPNRPSDDPDSPSNDPNRPSDDPDSDHQDRPRTDDGRYAETVTPDDVLDLFPDHEPRTASEVADALGVVRRTAYDKLQALAERDDLERKQVGGRAVVFWRPDERPELTDDWL